MIIMWQASNRHDSAYGQARSTYRAALLLCLDNLICKDDPSDIANFRFSRKSYHQTAMKRVV